MSTLLGWRVIALAVAISVLVAFSWTVAVAQQTVVVERSVKLRRDPSAKHAEIRRLGPGEELELQDTAKVNNYYHVVLAESHDTGWVWANNVRVGTAQPDTSTGTAAVATSIDPNWQRPAPVTGTFSSSAHSTSCGPVGDPGDSATNRRKNRTDVPQSYHATTFAAVADLAYPATRSKDRTEWPAESIAVIQRVEGAAVQVIGYLVALKPQTGGSGETTNCHWTQAAEVDWHVALVEHPGDGEATSIVVETTPRVRARHSPWTVARLTPWVDSSNPVRVSGWLLFDPAHRNHLGRYRKTLWEIHPITRIEVWQAGSWVDLDSLP